jgi:hypothetical protein
MIAVRTSKKTVAAPSHGVIDPQMLCMKGPLSSVDKAGLAILTSRHRCLIVAAGGSTGDSGGLVSGNVRRWLV